MGTQDISLSHARRHRTIRKRRGRFPHNLHPSTQHVGFRINLLRRPFYHPPGQPLSCHTGTYLPTTPSRGGPRISNQCTGIRRGLLGHLDSTGNAKTDVNVDLSDGDFGGNVPRCSTHAKIIGTSSPVARVKRDMVCGYL